jgi:hypothetical protein
LLGAHFARAAAHLEAAEPFHALLFEQLVPAPDRVVVEQQNLGLATPIGLALILLE